MGKILRRCSLCGGFHASFLVPELGAGKGYLCARCWKEWTAKHPPEKQPSQKRPDINT